MRYRKKPVVIDAVSVADICGAGSFDEWRRLPAWVDRAVDEERLRVMNAAIEVTTLEGKVTVGTDYWLIRGVRNELYPCKADIFLETYEPADEA